LSVPSHGRCLPILFVARRTVQLEEPQLKIPPPTGPMDGKRPNMAAAWLRALRWKQWVKNSVLLAGVLFTMDQGHTWVEWLRVAAGIAVFCVLSSAIYLINDVCDIEQDRTHPKKRQRPIPAGLISSRSAIAVSISMVAVGITGAVLLGRPFAEVAVAYVALTVAYSIWLKHEVLIDVLALAGCYVLRAFAGAKVINVEISPWLFLCTLLGALLLGLAKRRNELITLESAASHRRILEEYSVPMLDQLIGVVTAATLVSYMLYTFFSDTAQRIGAPSLMMTIPFVVYGTFRFLYLMHRHGKGGDPSADLLEDRRLVWCGLLWALTCAAVIAFSH
jgi:4-hydroxybenzoate polyprenyltransferase